ncbi:MAG: CDGSH iron-sulfur domain-containing protein [Planctomycetota bacterium]
MAEQPDLPQKQPYVLQVSPGRYAWCACGRSANQPYCDGSHRGTGFVPVLHEVTEATRVAWCGCKRSANQPLCDGSHGKL